MSTEKSKFSVNVDASLVGDFDKMVSESEDVKNRNDLIEKAMRYYRDSYYMKNKAGFINENILDMARGLADRLEMRLNHKSNQLLSELCIEVCILEQVLAGSIDMDGDIIAEYRKNAVDFLKTNQRVFRMDEIIE